MSTLCDAYNTLPQLLGAPFSWQTAGTQPGSCVLPATPQNPQTEVYYCLMAGVTNDHRFAGLEQHRFII